MIALMKAEDAALEIRRSIRQGILAPGDELIQEQVAAKLGVSRIPLREALQSLAATGIVTAEPGRGFRVTKLDRDEVAELYGLRLAIEPALAPAIVAAGGPAQVDRLTTLDADMRAADRPEQWAQLNYLFHVEMYAAAAGAHTLRLIRQLLDLVTPYSNLYVHGMGGQTRAEGEHAEMVAAIADRKDNKVEEQIRLHLGAARDAILDHMTAPDTDADLVSRLAGLND